MRRKPPVAPGRRLSEGPVAPACLGDGVVEVRDPGQLVDVGADDEAVFLGAAYDHGPNGPAELFVQDRLQFLQGRRGELVHLLAEEIERQLTVDMRRLRDPAVLTRRAAEGGFGRADRLIDLEGPPSRAGQPGPGRRSIALAVTRSGARR